MAGARALKPWIPALDMGRSSRFYLDLGFACRWSTGECAEFSAGRVAFVLHDDYMAVVAENTVLQLDVANVDPWWRRAHEGRFVDVYGVHLTAVESRADGGREFSLTDPAGVRWRFVESPGGD